MYFRPTHGLKRHIGNGRLLALAQDQSDVFITGDCNLSFQQEVTEFRIAIVVPRTPGTPLHETFPLMPRVLAVLPTLVPGTVVFVP